MSFLGGAPVNAASCALLPHRKPTDVTAKHIGILGALSEDVECCARNRSKRSACSGPCDLAPDGGDTLQSENDPSFVERPISLLVPVVWSTADRFHVPLSISSFVAFLFAACTES